MQKDKSQVNAFFGKDTVFEGKLTFSGTARIDGSFRGEIISEGTLIVGETGIVEANVTTSQLNVNGEVSGNIVAKSGIEVSARGKIMGDIQTPRLKIEEGALFDGHCRMHEQKDLASAKKLTSIRGDEAAEKRDDYKKSL